jgi:putative methyltransferase (TIGR04325 family)
VSVKPIRESVRPWLPPKLVDLWRSYRGTANALALTDLAWEQALKASGGYDDPVIVARAVAAARHVQEQEGTFERDGVLLPQGEVHWPILGPLFEARAHQSGTLRVLDVGGSLGSKWFQHRDFLPSLAPMKWAVVEQPMLVAAAESTFASDNLSFHATMADASAWLGGVDICVFSASLQYLQDPDKELREAAHLSGHSLLIDRSPVWEERDHHLAVQHVGIYEKPVSYPSWVMSRRRLMGVVGSHFERVFTWTEGMPFPAYPPRADIKWLGVLATGRRP